MRYLTYGAEKGSYKVAILVNDIRRDEIHKAYILPYNLKEDDIIVISLHQSEGKKKTSAAEQKAYILEMLKPTLDDLNVQYLMVADGDYFKTITKSPKVDPVIGYLLNTEFGNWKVAYVPNYRTIFYDPIKVNQKIKAGVQAIQNDMLGSYQAPGAEIIEFAEYPRTYDEIKAWLERLLEMNRPLTIDIEAFSLKHFSAGIGTITFCWSKTEGIAFPVDYEEIEGASQAPYGQEVRNEPVRALILDFFLRFQAKAIYHNISYDVYVLIYQLFMEHLLDNEGLLIGLEVMLKNWDDTKLITYLATNSCAGNELGLKAQAQEYAGNYSQGDDIKDIRNIPLTHLLRYNLVDGLSTWFVYEKRQPQMARDQQLDIYETLFKPAIVDIIQMQLTGMPINMDRVVEIKPVLMGIYDSAMERMLQLPFTQAYEYKRLEAYTNAKNTEWKNKRMTVDEMAELAKTHEPTRKAVSFNPNSDPQLQELLFDELQLPVLDYTKTKAPSTGGKTLEKLLNYAQTDEVREFLKALIELKAVGTILETFIPALEGAQLGPDGWHWLYGNFNLGGTVSGRLSSSKPNLQNIPANVSMKLPQWLIDKYSLLKKFAKDGTLSLGKLIKYCFMAPPGWFFGGLDFASLEDRISALTTKDPNKLKVYTDGYDGHAMRAVAYFGDQMPEIDPNDVNSVNQIAEKGHKYGHFRQESKSPTFLLTYGGTFIGIMRQFGWTQEKAQNIEDKYHVLYFVSDQWIQTKLDQATRDGYITAAFGLRVRTPLLHQVVLRTGKTPFAAEAEGRTAGNALGQSWCLLNTRAGFEFLGKVRKSEHRNSIKPCAQIHDANYVLMKDDIDVVHYTNIHLVKASEWQNHPDIYHPDVGLGGELSIFYPSWGEEVVIPNGASQELILSTFESHIHKLTK